MFGMNESTVAEDRRDQRWCADVEHHLGRKLTADEMQWDSLSLRDEAGLSAKETAEELAAPGTHVVDAAEPTEPTAKQVAYEELAHAAHCGRNNSYDVDEDDAMLGFDVVGPDND